jgi:hypothetical protein
VLNNEENEILRDVLRTGWSQPEAKNKVNGNKENVVRFGGRICRYTTFRDTIQKKMWIHQIQC